MHPKTQVPWIWWGALSAFVLAASTGALMRFGFRYGFPGGLNFINLRHAHSHLMYFGWVTPVLMALIATRLLERIERLGRPKPRFPVGIIAATLLLGLASYLPFFQWGYQPAMISGIRLPISVIVASLNMIAWYVYIAWYIKIRRGLKTTTSLRLWDAALVFMILASLGAWGRAVLVALKVDDLFLTTAMIHLFLDLFSDGWFLLALLGLAYESVALRPPDSELANRLLFLGLPVTFLLGIPVNLVPGTLRTIAGLGGILAVVGTAIHLRNLWAAQGKRLNLWHIPLSLLGVKIAFQAAASFAPLAVWGEQMGLRIFYLHIMLLGFVSLGLLAAAQDAWGRRSVPYPQLMTGSVLALLASLIPLTGLWPERLGGVWMVTLAAWIALLPVFAASAMLVLAGLSNTLGSRSSSLKRTQA